jgi:hypothetical protein
MERGIAIEKDVFAYALDHYFHGFIVASPMLGFEFWMAYVRACNE